MDIQLNRNIKIRLAYVSVLLASLCLGACSADDYAVQMDLNLAKMLHQKWKETIEVSVCKTKSKSDCVCLST